jgi:hypothetical protein
MFRAENPSDFALGKNLSQPGNRRLVAELEDPENRVIGIGLESERGHVHIPK